MDSTAKTAPWIINELLPGVTPGFDSPNSPLGLINDQRTAVTSDAWILIAQTPP